LVANFRTASTNYEVFIAVTVDISCGGESDTGTFFGTEAGDDKSGGSI
jgi:hypothetical protein